MSNFISGFAKSAGTLDTALKSARIIGKGAKDIGSGAMSGLKSSMKGTVGDALGLKGLSHLSDAAKSQGLSGLKNRTGRKAWGEAVGKAAPSLAAGTAYAVGAKKVYDKTLGSSGQQQYY